MSEIRKTVKVHIDTIEVESLEGPFSDVFNLLKNYEEMEPDIPELHFNLIYEYDYDERYAYFEIIGHRPETDEEYNARIEKDRKVEADRQRREKKKKENKERKERILYKQLHMKYGPDGDNG